MGYKYQIDSKIYIDGTDSPMDGLYGNIAGYVSDFGVVRFYIIILEYPALDGSKAIVLPDSCFVVI